MLSWYQLAQLAFALATAGVIAERVRALHYRFAISEHAFRWLLRELAAGHEEVARAWASERPDTQAARLLLAADEDEADLRELLLDLRDEAFARLSLLRVAATLGSTLGLLGGILTFTGVLRPNAGLLALQAGAVERLTMQHAIATMAIGVATSALCFQALSLLRPAAQRLLKESRALANALGSETGAPG